VSFIFYEKFCNIFDTFKEIVHIFRHFNLIQGSVQVYFFTLSLILLHVKRFYDLRSYKFLLHEQ